MPRTASTTLSPDLYVLVSPMTSMAGSLTVLGTQAISSNTVRVSSVIPESATERAPVSRESVVDAALALLAEGGLEAVSFRRIAKVLGVSGPTLYWHVENKRQLMDLMAEELVRRTGRSYDGPAPGPALVGVAARRRPADVRRAHRHPGRPTRAGRQPAQPRQLRGHRAGAGRAGVGRGHDAGQAQQTLFAIGAYVIGSATEWQAEAERAAPSRCPTLPTRS